MQKDILDTENLKLLKFFFEEKIPFNKLLELKVLEVSQGFAKVKIPYRPELLGEIRENRIHGGVITSSMDSTGGMAAMTTINITKDKIATIDLRTDFLSPAQAEDLIFEAKVGKSGTRVIFVTLSAYHPSNPDLLVSEGRATYSVKRAE